MRRVPRKSKNYLEGVEMLSKIRKELKDSIDVRLNLEGDAWLLLEEFGKLSQIDLHGGDKLRYSLARDGNYVYYVKPGSSVVFSLLCDHFDAEEYGSANDVFVRDVPSDALVELLRLSEI